MLRAANRADTNSSLHKTDPRVSSAKGTNPPESQLQHSRAVHSHLEPSSEFEVPTPVTVT